jgi:hypothetical protein
MYKRFLLVALNPLSSKVFRYLGTSELQYTNNFHISIKSNIKLLNNSSYFLHSHDGATTVAPNNDSDTDDNNDTLSTVKGVKPFSLCRLTSFSLPAIR